MTSLAITLVARRNQDSSEPRRHPVINSPLFQPPALYRLRMYLPLSLALLFFRPDLRPPPIRRIEKLRRMEKSKPDIRKLQTQENTRPLVLRPTRFPPRSLHPSGMVDPNARSQYHGRRISHSTQAREKPWGCSHQRIRCLRS